MPSISQTAEIESVASNGREVPRGALLAARLLSCIFFASGFASLLYQVAWQRLLTVHYGVGSISVTLIVSVYMLGLGFGALCGGYLSERVSGTIRLYATIEAAIALFGLTSLSFLELLGDWTAGSDYITSLACICSFLCVPTFLMGMTLPVATKIFSQLSLQFFSSVSILYFLNTLGAACGALVGAYLIVSFFGLGAAVFVAVGINAVLAGLILIAHRVAGGTSRPVPPVPAAEPRRPVRFSAYPFVFVSGFLAIGYEIAWFRVNEVLTKNSPYSFATVLFVYLLGIALGSLVIHRSWDRLKTHSKTSLFFLLQAGIGIYVILSILGYWHLTNHTGLDAFTQVSFNTHPHPVIPFVDAEALSSTRGVLKAIYGSVDILLWPVIFILIPTMMMGATFPLLSFLAYESEKEGKTVGVVYCWNIVGNVAGGIVTGFVLLQVLGTEITLGMFGAAGVILGIFAGEVFGRKVRLAGRLAVATVILVVSIAALPGRGALFRMVHASSEAKGRVHVEEGVDSVVVTYEAPDRICHYINGLSHGHWPMVDAYHDILEAARCAEKAERVLVIGFGTGTYTEALLKIPSVKKITLVELCASAVRNLMKIPAMNRLLTDERVDLIIDDGRRILLRTEDRYDLIASDPLNIRSGYSNNLYSREFFSLVKSRLEPGGTLLTFNQGDGVVTNTALSVFDHVRVYRTFCVCSRRPPENRESVVRSLLDGLTPEERQILRQRDSWFLGDESRFRGLLRSLPVNTDHRPVAEYFLGIELLGGSSLDRVLPGSENIQSVITQ